MLVKRLRMKDFPLLVIFQLIAGHLPGQLVVKNLLVESLRTPIGLDAKQPRFSWQLTCDKRNCRQTAYELKVSLGKSYLWHSGKVSSDQSVYVRYAGTPLASEKNYTWQVRTWDNHDQASAWSDPATFQMALLNGSGWKAEWIEPGFIEDTVYRPSPLFRKEFR